MRTIYEPSGRAAEFSGLALNLYTACNLSCKYCFNSKTPWYKPQPCRARLGLLPALEKAASKGPKDKREVLLCFTSDPYPLIPASESITRPALEILGKCGWGVQILSKAGMRATADFDLLKKYGWKYGSSLTCVSEQIRLNWEPNTASFASRVDSLVMANAMNIYTWVSLEPVLDPKETLWIIEHLLFHEYTRPQFWKLGKLNYEKSDIDWKDYLQKARKILDDNGQNYFIKNDLVEAGK
ncbi:MAG: radical SAM protein [Thiothrix sp.]|uniref:radical SAM protein n=1 Tax=Thiothrix sp. TaxID=1032 RepID=UPI002606AE72|nr:radical SAM protein [Thiothrix sp.]MDD5394908.1 radical SAM protein [Thiothrix sp.]